RRVRGRQRDPVELPGPQKADAGESGAVRVRHAAGWRRAGTPVRQVLSGRDDLPALRHRGGVSLSLGDGAAPARMDRVRPGAAVLRAAPRGLRLRLAQGRARLGDGEGLGAEGLRPGVEISYGTRIGSA